VYREYHEGFVVIRLAGQFVASTALTAEANLALALSARPARVVVEMQQVTEIDATAMTMLLATAQVAADRDGFVRLAAPPEPVSAALDAGPATRVSAHRSVGHAVRGVATLRATDGGESGRP
jgi:anti-anti-sigma factor